MLIGLSKFDLDRPVVEYVGSFEDPLQRGFGQTDIHLSKILEKRLNLDGNGLGLGV